MRSASGSPRDACPRGRSPAARSGTTSPRCRREWPSGGQTRVHDPMAVTTEQTGENTCVVLDHGFVALDGALASDLAVVNAARVSFNVRSDEMTERDEG